MTNFYDFLHLYFNEQTRYKYPYSADDISSNGIYIMFEEGEFYNGIDRIVRVGSHTSNDNLLERLNDHFIGDNHRVSIFRKHLGRCFLTIDNQIEYIKFWDIKNKDKKKYQTKIDIDIENKYESKITKYIRNKFSFNIIPNLTDKSERKRLEKALIATLAQANERLSSKGWLGNYHPNL